MDLQTLLTLMLFQVVHYEQTVMLWDVQFGLFEVYVKLVPLSQDDLTV
jgi:hypothetical protein